MITALIIIIKSNIVDCKINKQLFNYLAKLRSDAETADVGIGNESDND